jgi:peptidoglycan hydrolase FlgJ
MTALTAYGPTPAQTGGAAHASAFAQNGTLRDATPAQRARAHKTAQDFEASYLSSMFGEMFEGVQVSEPFGGGQGEAAFRSFMTDALAKSMTRRGGIGLTKVVTAEMLKLQGLK